MGRSGNTLAEVVVGVLLVGIVAASVMSVAVTSRSGGARVGRRTAAGLSGQRLLDALKTYVTADQTVMNGPGNGVDGWRLPGDS